MPFAVFSFSGRKLLDKKVISGLYLNVLFYLNVFYFITRRVRRAVFLKLCSGVTLRNLL